MSKHLEKSRPLAVKTADSDTGIVEALVATYDVDSVGDRIVPGAFADSIKAWEASGDSMPWIFSHQKDDLDSYLGDVLEMRETDEGLYVKAQHDMDDAKSAKAFRLLKGRRIKNFSFAYAAEGRPAKDDPEINELTKIDIFEAGPTLVGANRNTRTLSAKADGEQIIGVEGENAGDRGFTLEFSGEWTEVEKEAVLAAAELVRQGQALPTFDEQDDLDDTPDDDDAEPKDGDVSIKAGRVLSSKNLADLKTARESLDRVIAAAESDEETGKSHREAAPPKDDEPQAKSDEANQTEPSTDEDLELIYQAVMARSIDR